MTLDKSRDKDNKRLNVIITDNTKEINDGYSNPHSKKRRRIKLNPRQHQILEEAFQYDQKPSHVTKEKLAQTLNIPKVNIQIWFQNRRAKFKQTVKEAEMAQADPFADDYKLNNSYTTPNYPVKPPMIINFDEPTEQEMSENTKSSDNDLLEAIPEYKNTLDIWYNNGFYMNPEDETKHNAMKYKYMKKKPFK